MRGVPSLQEEKVPDSSGSRPVTSPQSAPKQLLWGRGGMCVKLPLQPLCCLGGGLCLSCRNSPGLRVGQRMFTLHHSGISLLSAPFQRRELVREALWCIRVILEAQNQSLPSQEPPPRMQVVQQSHPLSPSHVHQLQQRCPAGDEGSEARQSPSLQAPTPFPTPFFLTTVLPLQSAVVNITPGNKPSNRAANPRDACLQTHLSSSVGTR